LLQHNYLLVFFFLGFLLVEETTTVRTHSIEEKESKKQVRCLRIVMRSSMIASDPLRSNTTTQPASQPASKWQQI
jgi:hypothetical protein